jgi:clan AA aspartic protease (TIGR02281 family)
MPKRRTRSAIFTAHSLLNKGAQPNEAAEALKWYRLAANQGNPNAQFSIGVMYGLGQGGLEPNDIEAAKWYRLAAAQGYAPALINLALAYKDGLGVPQNDAEARRLLRVAADQGGSAAEVILREYGSPRWHLARPDRSPSKTDRLPSGIGVSLKRAGGTFVVPVQINGAITLDFTVDSGAADVSVPADVFSTLARTGTISNSDITGEQTYVLADGSTDKSVTFTIRSLRVGNRVVENVRGSVAPYQGSRLLGQSFLERFKSWSIDNT